MASSSRWTKNENKLMENALVLYPEGVPDRWEKVARAVGGGKTVEDVKIHYRRLFQNIYDLETGLVPLPHYVTTTANNNAATNNNNAANNNNN